MSAAFGKIHASKFNFAATTVTRAWWSKKRKKNRNKTPLKRGNIIKKSWNRPNKQCSQFRYSKQTRKPMTKLLYTSPVLGSEKSEKYILFNEQNESVGLQDAFCGWLPRLFACSPNHTPGVPSPWMGPPFELRLPTVVHPPKDSANTDWQSIFHRTL